MEERKFIGEFLKPINDEMRKKANNALRPQGLTSTQLTTLMELNKEPEKRWPLKELEEILHVAQSTAAGIISRLEQKGLAEGVADSEDQRVKLVKITPEGVALVQISKQGMRQAEEELLSNLTETEREILYILLEKIRKTL